MKRILITGATGNIGIEVIHSLKKLNSDVDIIAAVRNVEKAKKQFADSAVLLFRQFDFENSDTFSASFNQIDVLFLLRPPQISEVDKFFRPLLNSAKENGISKIVFISVQGAEKSRAIPHNKIERLIQELKFNYIFVRPSYFMQNLTTTLLPEIIISRSITLPSGNAKFNWVDVKNIGEASARLLLDFEKYQNQSFEITGTENKTFTEVTRIMTEITGERIRFRTINPLGFYFKKKKEGIRSGFALVMTILHFLPRFQRAPDISDSYQKLMGMHPTTLREFIEREKEKMEVPQLL
jgi:uncharacterized protein YbjT (DUF2867 family)